MSRLIKSTLFIALVAVFIASSAALQAKAQSIPGISEPVTFQISPEFPHANSSVTVSAQSFSTDLNRANFTWTVNGKTFKKGTGIATITVPVGTAAVTISVTIDTIDIGTITQTSKVRPGSVSLVWQADGYTPPFYKGKALELYGSSFKVTALPELVGSNGKRADPKTLVYTWRKNGTVDSNQSGYGKDSFTSEQSSYVRGGDDISVEVSTISRDAGATRTITISPVSSEVLFYEDSPLYGPIYEKALGSTFRLTGEEITLRAEPFNLSTINPESGTLTIDWTLNSASVPSFQNKNKITLRTTGTKGGQTNVGIAIQHAKNVLQGGQGNITIFQ